MAGVHGTAEEDIEGDLAVATHQQEQEQRQQQSQQQQRQRQSSRQRIDDILEGARSRRVALGDHHSISMPTSPRDRMTTTTAAVRDGDGGHGRGDGGGGNVEGPESSADENTSMMRDERRRQDAAITNYQSTGARSTGAVAATGAAAAGDTQLKKTVKSKPSTSSIRRAGRVIPPEQHGEADVDEHESWWARLISDYGSIELENKGSVARDHLALERTFLAWLRTSLAFASIGIAITQLFRLNTTSASPGGGGSSSISGIKDPYQQLRHMGKPLGATFLGISILMLFVGFHRYFESQHWIIRGKFPASRGSIALVAAITFALMVTSLVIVITVEPGRFEKR